MAPSITRSRTYSEGSFPSLCPTQSDISLESVVSGSCDANKECPTKIFLNVYDLSPVNKILGQVGVGLYHSGVEIDGWEYSFASKGGGIFKIAPKTARGVRFCEQIEVGILEHDEDGVSIQVTKAIEALRDEFQPNRYDLVERNCNHFCNALLLQLVGKPLPGHVNRMSYIFANVPVSWFVPKKLRKIAPVGDKTLAAYQGLVPFLQSTIKLSIMVVKEWMDINLSSISNISERHVVTSKKLATLFDDAKAK